MPNVVVHGTRTCGYCYRARRLLDQRGIAHEFVDVTGDHAARRVLFEKTGRTSVPQIWIGDRWIGGCDDLEALADSGELADLMASG